MFNLLRNFSLTSACVIVFIVAVLMVFFRHLTVEDLINVGERQNEILTRSIGNSIWDRFGPYLSSIKEADRETVLSKAKTEEISKRLTSQVEGLSVLAVNILNLKGIIIFSTSRNQINEDRSNDAGYIAAREGRVASRTTVSGDDDLSKIAGNSEILASYQPFRNSAGTVVAIFEIISDVTLLVEDINKHIVHVFFALLAALSLLYVVLYQFVRRADKTIKRQHVDLQSSEKDLREKERRLAEAQSLAHMGSWEHDLVTNSWVWSDELYKIFGYPPKAIPSNRENFLHHVHEDDRELVEELIEQVSKHGRFEADYRIVNKDGKTLHVHSQADTKTGGNSMPTLIQGILQDFTESRLTQAKLNEMQKIETIGQFASGVAHNLNNLLQPVLTNTSIVRDSLPKDSENGTRLDMVISAAKSAGGLVNQISKFSRRSTVEMNVMDACEIFTKAVELVQAMLTSEMEINVQLEKNIGFIKANRSELEAVVVNLAANAIESMNNHPKVLSVSLEEYTGPDQSNGSSQDGAPKRFCSLTISDTGCGIAEDQLPKIFEPLYTTKISDIGIGLGLSSVKNSIERHKGMIEVTSMLGTGTTFHILLPIIETPTA